MKLGVNSADDLAKLKVSSIDDLAKIGINSSDLKKLGIDPEVFGTTSPGILKGKDIYGPYYEEAQ